MKYKVGDKVWTDVDDEGTIEEVEIRNVRANLPFPYDAISEDGLMFVFCDDDIITITQ